MAEDNEEVVDQITDPVEDPESVENTPEDGAEGSPPPQKDDSASKLREYEEKLAREQDRNRYLEQTNQLLDRFAKQNQAPAPTPERFSPELEALDATLDPLFKKRMQGQLDPLNQTIASTLDSHDALRFELYLMRKRPEVLEDEDAYNKTVQQVEWVKQQALQMYGKALSRVDAYVFAQGMETEKEKSKSRTTKRQTQVKEEAKRQLQNQATKSGVSQPDVKKVSGGDIDSLRRRMLAGEKLTREEAARFEKHLGEARF